MILEPTFLQLFLFDAKYRPWRHLLFIVIGVIITFNQVFIAYQDSQENLGNRIYFICFLRLFLYMLAMYVNYFYLTPKFLLKGRYLVYSITLCTIVFSLPTLSILEEYWVRHALDLPHRISSYTSPLILVDNLAACMITAICFFGISVVMVFREWTTGNEHVSRLESEHLKSELNKLKGQVIAPAFLSKTLRNASNSAETDPEKTIGMLMQLGQLLRYQLYDCDRDRILFKSELDFLTKFLKLETVNRVNIQYDIQVKGDISKAFVSPMLFFPLVQYAIEDHVLLDLFFNLENGLISFRCKSNGKKKLTDDEVSLIKRRLELQYPEKHTLMLGPGMVELNITISE